MCCDSEQAKWAKAEAERQARHAARGPDEIRRSLRSMYALRDGTPGDLAASMVRQLNPGSIDRAALDRAIADEEALLDTEYRRRFADGPVPMFSARFDSTADMELLKSVIGGDAIASAFGPRGRGVIDIEERAAKAREQQA